MKNNILEQINFAHPGITELYERLLEMKFHSALTDYNHLTILEVRSQRKTTSLLWLSAGLPFRELGAK